MEQSGHVERSEPDARPRGTRDANRVREFSLRGNMLLKARVDGAIQASVVSAKLGWVKFTQGESEH